MVMLNKFYCFMETEFWHAIVIEGMQLVAPHATEDSAWFFDTHDTANVFLKRVQCPMQDTELFQPKVERDPRAKKRTKAQLKKEPSAKQLPRAKAQAKPRGQATDALLPHVPAPASSISVPRTELVEVDDLDLQGITDDDDDNDDCDGSGSDGGAGGATSSEARPMMFLDCVHALLVASSKTVHKKNYVWAHIKAAIRACILSCSLATFEDKSEKWTCVYDRASQRLARLHGITDTHYSNETIQQPMIDNGTIWKYNLVDVCSKTGAALETLKVHHDAHPCTCQ